MSEANQPKSEVEIRPEILSLPAYVPGRPAPAEAAKLSSNENPYPPIPEVIAAMTKALMDANRYPEMTSQTLAKAVAAFHGLKEDWIVCEDGSVALLAKAIQMVAEPGDEVIMPWRSFEAYPIIVQTVGAKLVQVPLTSKWAHDLNAMAQAIGENTRAILLCTPNNPTGGSLTEAELAEFMAKVPSRVLVILDEAYVDFDESPDKVDGVAAVKRWPNLISARTFSKAYGLAGMRVGYAIAHPNLAQSLRAVATPFAVNLAAQAGAVAALENQEIMRNRVKQICGERDATITALRRVGWQIPESNANFFFLPATDFDANELAQVLNGQGLITRPFPEGLRISLGTPAQNRKLVQVLTALRTPKK